MVSSRKQNVRRALLGVRSMVGFSVGSVLFHVRGYTLPFFFSTSIEMIFKIAASILLLSKQEPELLVGDEDSIEVEVSRETLDEREELGEPLKISFVGNSKPIKMLSLISDGSFILLCLPTIVQSGAFSALHVSIALLRSKKEANVIHKHQKWC